MRNYKAFYVTELLISVNAKLSTTFYTEPAEYNTGTVVEKNSFAVSIII